MSFSAWLESLPETRLHILVEDLLRAMRFKRIECVHGSGEVGKDIVFMEEDPLHRQVWRAAQIKTKITGDATSELHSLGVVRQCEGALRNQYQTSQGLVSIKEVWLILSHRLHDHAKR